jgi:hypothetical protein
VRRTALTVLAAAIVAGSATSIALAALSPAVSTGAASKIKDTSATLSAKVNPNGAATTYYFQWGPTTAYGFTSKSKSAGKGTTTVSVSQAITKLVPGIVYHYHVVAQNSFGPSIGSDRTFKTTGHPLPGAVTGAASGVTTSSAIVSGAVLTNGQDTSYYFQYGLVAGSYTSQSPQGTAHASSTPVNVAAPLTLLPAGTTIHYRLVAVHTGFGPIDGADATFTTLPLARPYANVQASTAPHHARSKPFTFTTVGTVVSSAFPAAAECNGQVEIRYLFAMRAVSDKLVTVQSNCTFASQVQFARRFKLNGHRPQTEHFKVTIRFLGNSYLAPARHVDHTSID